MAADGERRELPGEGRALPCYSTARSLSVHCCSTDPPPSRAPVAIAPPPKKKPQTPEERIYRHRCVEAWAIVVPWIGFPLRKLVTALKPLPGAKYIRFETDTGPYLPNIKSAISPNAPWPYVEGLATFVSGFWSGPRERWLRGPEVQSPDRAGWGASDAITRGRSTQTRNPSCRHRHHRLHPGIQNLAGGDE